MCQSHDSHESSDWKSILKDKQDNIRCTKEKRRCRKHSEMRGNGSPSKKEKKASSLEIRESMPFPKPWFQTSRTVRE